MSVTFLTNPARLSQEYSINITEFCASTQRDDSCRFTSLKDPTSGECIPSEELVLREPQPAMKDGNPQPAPCYDARILKKWIDYRKAQQQYVFFPMTREPVSADVSTEVNTRQALANQRRILAAGWKHSVALSPSRGVVGWGSNEDGQASAQGVPGEFTAVAAGWVFSIGLRRDGTILTWGYDNYGQVRDAPSGKFVAIAAGFGNGFAITTSGNIECWGSNEYGQAPPNGVPGNFIAVSAGTSHALAIRRDGSIQCWGDNRYQQSPSNVPGDFIAISAAFDGFHSYAVRRDGTILHIGMDRPDRRPPTDGKFVDVAASGGHAIALRENGSVTCWGHNYYGQAPRDVSGNFVAIAVGCDYSLALAADGSVVCWGNNSSGQAPPRVVFSSEVAQTSHRITRATVVV